MIAALPSASKAVWYLTRGTGIMSLLLLTGVTVLGIVNSIRWSPQRSPRFVLQHLHRNISVLSVAFIVVHIATAVLDAFAPIRWLDVVVPFGSAYRPIWLGLGALAFDLLIAVTITSLVRARLGPRLWRAVHWTSYACWGVAVFHGLGVGSDSTQGWMLGLTAVSVGSVVGATAWRVAVGWQGWTPARVTMASGTLVVPLVLGAWLIAGPLQPGWAARAGTPANLLSRLSPKVAAPAPAPKPVTPLMLPPQATAQGTTVLHRLSGGMARVNISLQTSTNPNLDIQIVLNGAQSGQGVAMNSGSAVLTPPRGAAVYQGSVTSLSGTFIGATLSDGHGDQISLTLQLQIQPDGQTTAQVDIQSVSSIANQSGAV